MWLLASGRGLWSLDPGCLVCRLSLVATSCVVVGSGAWSWVHSAPLLSSSRGFLPLPGVSPVPLVFLCSVKAFLLAQTVWNFSLGPGQYWASTLHRWALPQGKRSSVEVWWASTSCIYCSIFTGVEYRALKDWTAGPTFWWQPWEQGRIRARTGKRAWGERQVAAHRRCKHLVQLSHNAPLAEAGRSTDAEGPQQRRNSVSKAASVSRQTKTHSGVASTVLRKRLLSS